MNQVYITYKKNNIRVIQVQKELSPKLHGFIISRVENSKGINYCTSLRAMRAFLAAAALAIR